MADFVEALLALLLLDLLLKTFADLDDEASLELAVADLYDEASLDLAFADLAEALPDLASDEALFDLLFPDLVVLIASVAVVVVIREDLHSQVSPTKSGYTSHEEINPAIPMLCSTPQGMLVGGSVLNVTNASRLPTSIPSPQMLHFCFCAAQ